MCTRFDRKSKNNNHNNNNNTNENEKKSTILLIATAKNVRKVWMEIFYLKKK